jgi:hypothetical protein
MGSSQYVEIGHFISVPNDFNFYDFVAEIESDDIACEIEDNFGIAEDVEKDDKNFIIPKRDDFEDHNSIDLEDEDVVTELNSRVKWDERWKPLFNELKKNGIKFDKHYGVLAYLY